jgi:GntR family transcriptional regulator / MocR family aminotransferase
MENQLSPAPERGASIESWITLDRRPHRGPHQPLAEQIYRQMRLALIAGACPVGTRLPSSRVLAQRLGVARNGVIAAFDLLVAEGLIAVRAGAAPVVIAPASAAGAVAQPPNAITLSSRGRRHAHDRHEGAYALREGALRPGLPDPALFPRDLWGRFMRRAVRMLGDDHLLYQHTQGLPALCTELARYLGETRGLRAGTQDVLILPSTQAGLALLAQALCEDGDAVWVEDPGYSGARVAFAGCDLIPMPVDAEGADPSGMTTPPRLIYVSPSHHYPTGVRMTLARRKLLLERAQADNAVIVEDDYDSEFLWQGRPVPALQALSGQGRVVYIGTLAKSLLPGLRLAYMVAPGGLAQDLAQIQRNLGMLVNIHTQAAFADFLASGHYRAHLALVRATYRARAALITQALARHGGHRLDIGPVLGGLQMLVQWQGDPTDQAVAAELARAGFATPVLSAMSKGAARHGLVVGFARATAEQAEHFAAILHRMLA